LLGSGALGYPETSIQTIWREHGLKPHLSKTFKVSRDPTLMRWPAPRIPGAGATHEMGWRDLMV
jgi:hypothetical protein